jgi:hypothetical protein
MNILIKVFLAAVVLVGLACFAIASSGFMATLGAGAVLKTTLKTDPAKVAQVSNSIASFAVPPGFGNPMAAKFLGFSMVSYTGADQHSHIYLFTVPSWIKLDPAALANQVPQTGSASQESRVSVQPVGEQQVTIAGQPVTISIAEGLNHDHQLYRTATGVFRGKAGPTFVSVSGLVDSWEQAAFDQFFASIQ